MSNGCVAADEMNADPAGKTEVKRERLFNSGGEGSAAATLSIKLRAASEQGSAVM